MAISIGKAIKLIQADIADESVDWNSPLGEAYKMSFEALKREKYMRETYPKTPYSPLPGEARE